jgi:spore germination protein (amino acid permease)
MNPNKVQLTPHQFTIILMGSMIGMAIMSLPNDVIRLARQDGWISAGLGGAYPVYMILIANFFAKKYPDSNILQLSKLCFGKFCGTIFNFIFVTYFIVDMTMIASGISNILRIYMIYYLTNDKILITIFLIPAFVAFKGLKTLGRMNEIIFYLTIPVFVIPILVLKDGSILNLMPPLDAGLLNILKASMDSIASYGGIEVVFLFYPFLNDKNKMKACTLTSVAITIAIYMWIVFITIYYLNIYTIPKFLWSVITVSENISITFINSFRFINIALWALIGLKILSIHYYTAAFGLSEIIKNIDIKIFVYVLCPIFFFLSRFYGPPTVRRAMVSKLVFFYTLFNILYISTVAIIIYFKKGDKHVK